MDAPDQTKPVAAPSVPANTSYIRTYAKDVARITGKPVPSGKISVSKKDLDLPKKPKTLEEELTPTNAAMEALPSISPEAGGKEVPTIESARTEILARLKSQGNIEVAPAPVVAPTPKPPPLPPMPQVRKEPTPSPLHTFKTDFADRIDTKRASQFSVLAAQQDAPRTIAPTMSSKHTSLPIAGIVGGVLLVAGIAGITLAVMFTGTKPTVPVVAGIPSLIFFDTQKELNGSGADLMQALADTANDPLADGTVLVTYLTQSSTTPNGTITTPLPGGALIAALGLPAPDILLRNIDAASTVGVIRAGEETKPFFVLRVSSYERTFAGMLSWEGTVGHDLTELYPAYATVVLPVASSSTTVAPGRTTILPLATAEPVFKDQVVANHDVRMLTDAQGRSVLLYGYKDKQTLIIARDAAAFTAILNRLAATKTN